MLVRTVDDKGKVTKDHIQLRYMLMSLREAYEQFCNTYSDVKIGVSKFADLRPKHIRLFDQIPHNVCVCIYHENVRLLLNALKTFTNLSTEFSSFINQIVCNPSEKACMYSECEDCHNKLSSFKPLADIENSLLNIFNGRRPTNFQR